MGLTPLAPLAGLGALGHAVQTARGAEAVCANAPSYWAAFLRLLQRPPGFFAPLSEAHAAALAAQEPGLAGAGRCSGASCALGTCRSSWREPFGNWWGRRSTP